MYPPLLDSRIKFDQTIRKAYKGKVLAAIIMGLIIILACIWAVVTFSGIEE